jgi:hypothetical protein
MNTLTGHNIAQNFSVAHNGGSGIITGRFNGKDVNIL